ncbi:deoxyribonuclease V [Oscillatoria sp. FACHB-1407]|uniref:deoxyribonuclease V n=1 Tax=Oscillatoria sp. FACHB-1407 TaxID=2692847 RepID=UPI0016851B6B|nr:deoxyribonuclease V [Oscillatoria sp. FACHB-1407]MBD2461680.1 deoxyribonuclease V [Oscillatoria sp. FACHB-1407]
MKIHQRHEWNLTAEEAIALQHRLQSEVITTDQLEVVQHVAGVDVGFEEDGTVTRAAVTVLTFPRLQLKEQVLARRPTSFPYIPGLLSFREVPAVLEALEQLQIIPDLLLCDGQGTAHPRRLGIACHLGLLTNIPSVGVGKSLLVGTHADVPDEKGAWVPLQHKGETIGAVVRTRVGTKPLYISPGHRISLKTAIAYVMQCTTKYRLPETTRFAHKLASEMKDQPVQLGQQQLSLGL